MTRTTLVLFPLLLIVTSHGYGQIETAAAGCAVIEAAVVADSAEDVVAISIEVWSMAVEPWTYKVETSTGSVFIVSSDAAVLHRQRDAQSESRRQLERSATARSIRAGDIPGLCDLFATHYRDAPGSILLEAEIEYERGAFEADLEYRSGGLPSVTREREWAW
jgi:hypothetical protein